MVSRTYTNLAEQVQGTLPVPNGGTGSASLTSAGLLVGNGVSAVSTLAPGTSGNVPVSNGSAWVSQALTAPSKVSILSSASTSLTLSSAYQVYEFTGSSAATWTLPAVSGNTGLQFNIVNGTETAALTVVPTGSDTIVGLSSIGFGASGAEFPLVYGLTFINDGTTWQINNSFLGFSLPDTFSDGSFELQNSSDTTKSMFFNLGNLTTGRSLTLDVPNVTIDTLVGAAATQTLTSKTLTTPVLNGTVTGTSVSSTPTASTLAQWDANANMAANAFHEGFTATTTAGGTTTLTITSTATQQFTGTSNQTLVLPTTSVVAGTKYRIINNSTGAITVNASGGTTVVTMSANTDCAFTALAATPTTPAGWEAQYGGTTVTVSAAGTLTLSGGNQCYVFSGSTATWTLPALAGNTGSNLILENRGSGAITVNTAGSDHIWFNSAVTTMTIGAGGSLPLINDGTYWNSIATDLTHNAVGTLAVANGGTGGTSQATAQTGLGLVIGTNVQAYNATLTSWAAKTVPAGTVADLTSTQTMSAKTLTAPVMTGYSETVQALGTIGATKTLPAVSSGTLMWGTLTSATAATITLPTAAAGVSFLLALRQPASGTAVAVTWASSPVVKWPAATAPTITATVGKADLLSFICYDGTNWYGSVVQNYTY